MRKLLATMFVVLTCLCVSWAQSSKTPSSVTLAGATWHGDIYAAREIAEQTQKPLLVFDMIGRLDEKWC